MTHRLNRLDALAMLLLLACCLVWGAQQVLIKLTLVHIPPLLQASARLGGATLCLLLWCQWRGLSLWQRDDSLWPGLLAGLLFALEFACIYLGLMDTPASRLTIFLYTAPFWVALCVPLVVRAERLGPWQWLGLLVAFVSVGCAMQEGLQGHAALPFQWRGDLLGLLAGALWGLTTVTIRTTQLGHASAEKMLLYQIGGGALLLAVLSVCLGEPWPAHAPAWAWGSVAMQSAIGGFASILVWMWLLRRYPSTQVSAFSFFTPLFAVLLSDLWLDESLSLSLGLAMLGVAVGMLLVNRPRIP